MEYEIWCRCLRQYREQEGLTQQAVADGIKISRSHYSAIEHARKGAMVRYTQIYNLAKFFRVRMVDLIAFSMLKGTKGRLKKLPRVQPRRRPQR